MNAMIKLLITNKFNSIANLSYLLNSISNTKQYLKTPDSHLHNLTTIKNKISNPITEFITSNEITLIDKVADEFVSMDFANKVFKHKNLSLKLSQLWGILNDLYYNDPSRVVDCVTNLIEKKIPKELLESNKNELTQEYLGKFLGTAKKINNVTDLIFKRVRDDSLNKTFDVLSICGILLSFVVNSQSHFYFVMENIKKAMDILTKKYDIEEIFSIESKVVQNTETTTDIQAIRNAVSHGSFDIRINDEQNDYIVIFESVLTGYKLNKMYTGNQLFMLYADYDRLRDFQEILIRIALLKATLRLYFLKN